MPTSFLSSQNDRIELHELYSCACPDCGGSIVQLALSETEENSLQKAFNKVVKWAHKNKKTAPTVDDLAEKAVQNLASTTNSILQEGMKKGIKHEMPEVMQRHLSESVYVFSQAKTLKELKEIGALLLDENGDRKPFYKFAQETEKIHANYNRNYLEAEYNFATHSAQAADNWAEFEEDGDRYNLQYRTANDEKVRASHAVLHDITLPPSDPFWDKYMTPNGWNCRCRAIQVLKKDYPVSDSKRAQTAGEQATTQIAKNGNNSAEIFRFNPGKQKIIFPENHPYLSSLSPKDLASIEERKEIQKLRAKEVLDLGRENIIGKYTFEHERFSASFVRNSFTENLRHGDLFNAKVEILTNIRQYLEETSDYKFTENNQPERKPNVKGYHSIQAVYRGADKKLYGRTVEFQFEDRGKRGVVFHFIKFLK